MVTKGFGDQRSLCDELLFGDTHQMSVPQTQEPHGEHRHPENEGIGEQDELGSAGALLHCLTINHAPALFVMPAVFWRASRRGGCGSTEVDSRQKIAGMTENMERISLHTIVLYPRGSVVIPSFFQS